MRCDWCMQAFSYQNFCNENDCIHWSRFKDQTEIRMLKSHDRVLTCHDLLAVDFQSIRVRGRVEEVRVRVRVRFRVR